MHCEIFETYEKNKTPAYDQCILNISLIYFVVICSLLIASQFFDSMLSIGIILTFVFLFSLVYVLRIKLKYRTSRKRLKRILRSANWFIGPYYFYQRNEKEGSLKNLCFFMNSRLESHPVCRKCIQESLTLTSTRLEETREKMRLVISMNLSEQAVGSRSLFVKSLPLPIRILLTKKDTLPPKIVLNWLRNYAPNARLFFFYPEIYEKRKLDVRNLDVNIPLKGLEFLKSLSNEIKEKGGKKDATPIGNKRNRTKKWIAHFFGSFFSNPCSLS